MEDNKELFNEEDQEEPKEPEKPRDINQLIDLPYSEMTEEEIEIVIAAKAEQKARDDEYEKRMQLAKETSDQIIAIHKEAAEHSQNVLDQLVANAMKLYEDA